MCDKRRHTRRQLRGSPQPLLATRSRMRFYYAGPQLYQMMKFGTVLPHCSSSWIASRPRQSSRAPRCRNGAASAALSLGAMAIAVGGCGAAEAPRVPLCDGSEGLTLRVFVAGPPGREGRGGAVRIENGFPSFAVDGQCRYYIGGGWGATLQDQGRDQGWREGVLDAELRESLEQTAGYEDLQEINDCGANDVDDTSHLIVANSRSSLRCSGEQGKRVTAIFQLVEGHARKLRETGHPREGAMHVVAGSSEYFPGPYPVYPWPTGLILRDYFNDEATNSDFAIGYSKLASGTDASQLRSAREAYLIDTAPGTSVAYYGSGIPMTDGELDAQVFLRDALPYENARGLWRYEDGRGLDSALGN